MQQLSISEMAISVGCSEKELMNIMQELADMIKRRFLEDNIPLTLQNIERALPLAMELRMRMLDELIHNDEKRNEFMNTVMDQLKAL